MLVQLALVCAINVNAAIIITTAVRVLMIKKKQRQKRADFPN